MQENFERNSTNVSASYDDYIASDVKSAKRAYSRYALSLFFFTVIAQVVSLIAEAVLILCLGEDGFWDLYSGNPYVQAVFQIVPMYLVAFPAFYLMIMKMRKMKVTGEKLSASYCVSVLFIAKAATVIGALIGNFVNSFISDVLNIKTESSLDNLVTSWPTWLVIAVVVIIGPIIEELMFRKFLIDRLSPYGTIGAIIFSAVTFGLIHGNFYQFFYAMLCGAILATVYAKSRKIIYPIALHILMNFFGSVAALPIDKHLAKFAEWSESVNLGDVQHAERFISMMAVYSYEIVTLTLAAIGVAIFITLLRRRQINIENTRIYTVPKWKHLDVSFMNAGSIIFFISSVLTFATEPFISILLTLKQGIL